MSEGLLIYGVTGYTGRLVLKEALDKGMKPVIAGRNEEKVRQLAEKDGLDYRVFDLSDVAQIVTVIREFRVVLHLAGPFRDTARPMAEACLEAGVHYLDITGEIAIMEWMKARDEEAKKAGIMLMCGVGFDLVPTDCVAVRLKEEMPDATHLKIAFYMRGGSISHGTMATMVGNLGKPGYTRINGKLQEEALGKKGQVFHFGRESKFCMSIPWGDLFSAYESTGIPNIDTYTSVSRSTFNMLRFQAIFNPILRSGLMQKLMHWYTDKYVSGPSEVQNRTGRSFVYGEVRNDKSEVRETLLETSESYRLTAQTSVLISQKVLAGHFRPGYQTPAQVYGQGLILEVPDTAFLI